MEESRLESFKAYFMKSIEVPADKVEALSAMWDWAAFTDSGTWKYDSTAFTKDSSGNAKYVTVMYSKDPISNKYTFFVANIKGTFQVAEDMYVYEKKTKVGVFFSSDEFHVEYLPHKITPDDV